MKRHPEVDAVGDLIASAHAACAVAAKEGVDLPPRLEAALKRLDAAVGRLEALAEEKRR